MDITFLSLIAVFIVAMCGILSIKQNKKKEELEERKLNLYEQKLLAKSHSELDELLFDMRREENISGNDIQQVLSFLLQNGVIDSHEYNHLLRKSLPFMK